jgi:hypothetical protein
MILYDGQPVTLVGGETTTRGHIVAVGSSSAHVKWVTGRYAGEITLTDLYDLEPITSSVIDDEADPLHLSAVAKVYSSNGERGVLNFLASNNYLDSWQKIASDVLDYTRQRIRTDASMELVEEQLTPAEQRKVVQAAALALLHDAFGPEEDD